MAQESSRRHRENAVAALRTWGKMLPKIAVADHHADGSQHKQGGEQISVQNSFLQAKLKGRAEDNRAGHSRKPAPGESSAKSVTHGQYTTNKFIQQKEKQQEKGALL